jgi:hypothetical protein
MLARGERARPSPGANQHTKEVGSTVDPTKPKTTAQLAAGGGPTVGPPPKTTAQLAAGSGVSEGNQNRVGNKGSTVGPLKIEVRAR